jgi:ammonia channel protein AmtB
MKKIKTVVFIFFLALIFPCVLLAAEAEDAGENEILHRAMNTSVAAAAGGIAALASIWFKVKKADLSMTMNGALAVGVFGQEALGLTHQGLIYGGGPIQLGIQILGSLATVVFIIVSMGMVFKLIDLTIGLRVSREKEYRGLDIGEHGMQSYSGFQIID